MSSNTEQSCCFKCPRNVINAPFNTEHNLFLMSYKSPQTSFPSVEAQTVVFHRKSPIFPQFLWSECNLYVSRKKACVHSGNLNLIYFGSMANHTVHMCQGLKSINLTLSIALNRCYYRLNTFPPTLELCLWVVRQLRWNWAKFAWYGHSAKLNYNCHLFSLTGLNCTWCVMAPALLEIARKDSCPVCSPREISAEWNDEGTCLKSEPFDSLQHPLKRQDLSCYGDFISTI